MNTNRSFPLSHPILILAILILPVLLSCSLGSYLGFNPTQTPAPTQLPQVTVMVVVQSPTPEMALIPTNTLEPTPTEQPAETVPVVLPTETETAIPVPEFVEVKNIQAIGWNFVNSAKCVDQKEGCWLLISYKQEASLEAKDYVYIDPNWANPYLVFWQKYISKGSSFYGFVEITGDTEVGWTQKHGYKGSNYSWKEEAIDLSEYKGSEILFRVMFVPSFEQLSPQEKMQYTSREWSIASFRVVPDYTP